jgi:hypothetical protein
MPVGLITSREIVDIVEMIENDYARLNSGGPLMHIDRIEIIKSLDGMNASVTCSWRDTDGCGYTREFPTACLTPALRTIERC